MVTTPLELLADLEAAGVQVQDLWDLVNGRVEYSAAVPVLITWLQRLEERVPEPSRGVIREGLVRALSVPAARPDAAPVLVEQFRSVQDPSGMGIRWVVGNALEVVGDDSVFGDLEVLARDRRYGKARQMVVLGLGRSKNPRAVSTLIELLGDEDVAAHAVMALGRLKATAARLPIESMLTHPNVLVRREAKKALVKLGPES